MRRYGSIRFLTAALAAGAVLLGSAGTGAALPGAEDGGDDSLVRARVAASEDRHAESIELYLRALDSHPDEVATIARELGLQYTWDDRPGEAERWFRRSLEEDPEDPATLLGLARAIAWQDRHKEALGLYRGVLVEHGGELSDDQDREARQGEADMLSYLDRLEEAEARFDTLLQRHPDALEARLGRARVVNWRGRHREAAALYRDVLETHPGNPEAVMGLALSERWGGSDRTALEVLRAHGENPDARRLLQEILAERRPVLSQEFLHVDDSDDIGIDTWVTRLHVVPGPGTTLRGLFTYRRIDGSGFPVIEADGWEGGGSARLPRALTANAYFRWNHLRSQDRMPSGTGLPGEGKAVRQKFWTYDLWLTARPARFARLDLGASRDYVETPTSVSWEVRRSTLSLGADLTLTNELLGIVQVRRSVYEDLEEENERWDFEVRLRGEKAMPRPGLTFILEPGFSTFSFEKTASDFENSVSAFVSKAYRGYYNPESYRSLGLGAGVRWVPGEHLQAEIFGRLASEKEKNGDAFSAGGGRATVSWIVGNDLNLEASIGSSRSRLDSASGYTRTWFSLGAGYRF
jgi:tetratricopeptide (TPR) repeat protein